MEIEKATKIKELILNIEKIKSSMNYLNSLNFLNVNSWFNKEKFIFGFEIHSLSNKMILTGLNEKEIKDALLAKYEEKLTKLNKELEEIN